MKVDMITLKKPMLYCWDCSEWTEGHGRVFDTIELVGGEVSVEQGEEVTQQDLINYGLIVQRFTQRETSCCTGNHDDEAYVLLNPGDHVWECGVCESKWPDEETAEECCA